MGCDIMARLPSFVILRLVGIECDLHNHYLPWTVCRSSCGRTVTVRLVHVASADLSSTDLAGLHEYAVGRCATQDCVIVLGDIDDGLLAMNACTFLVNYVVSLDPLGLLYIYNNNNNHLLQTIEIHTMYTMCP